jgi:hypothetical protein
MAGEGDQTLCAADEPIIDEDKGNSGMESDIPMAVSSSNMAATKIADKVIPDMSNYWKKSTGTDDDRKAYHSAGWLTGSLESSVSEVDVPIVMALLWSILNLI